MSNKIKALLCKPGEKAVITNDFSTELTDMQEFVHSYIELYYLSDTAVIICSDTGKLDNEPLNRPIYDEGQIVDVIAGNFAVVGISDESEDFLDLSPEDEKKYMKMYGLPTDIFMIGRSLLAVPYDPADALC